MGSFGAHFWIGMGPLGMLEEAQFDKMGTSKWLFFSVCAAFFEVKNT